MEMRRSWTGWRTNFLMKRLVRKPGQLRGNARPRNGSERNAERPDESRPLAGQAQISASSRNRCGLLVMRWSPVRARGSALRFAALRARVAHRQSVGVTCSFGLIVDEPFPSIEEMAAADAALVNVVRRQLPIRVYGGERWWTLYRTAALVRMTDTVESLLDLMGLGRDLDGQTLVRSLYEQVVTFAWIAIDPGRREWRWVGDGRWELLKLHNDAAQFGESLGDPVLSDEEVAESKQSLGLSDEPASASGCESAGRRRRRQPDADRILPPVTEMAEQADEHWSVRVRGLHPAGHALGFRGLYLPAYRVGSRAAHGALMPLDPYLSRELNRYVIHEPESGPRVMWALVGPLFGVALVIAARWDRWIDEDEVRALVDVATGPEVEDAEEA